MDTGPKKEQRTAKDTGEPDLAGYLRNGDGAGEDLQDFGIVPGSGDQIRLAATPADRQNAIDLPTRGWSGYWRLYDSTRGKLLRDEACRAAESFNLDPDTPYGRERGVDFASRALAASDATKVEQADFRLLLEDGSKSTLLMGLDFVVYTPENRPVRRRPNPYGQWGVR